MDYIFDEFLARLNINNIDVKTYSPLSLAYVGDTVYDFFVKFYLVSQGNRSVNDFHGMSKKYVKASEQAAILKKISHLLNEDEQRMIKRGRNAKSQSVPKNADRTDYQMATGFECLLGYLLLSKQYDRLMEIIVEGIQHDKTNPNND